MNTREFKIHQLRLERELSDVTPAQPTEEDLQRASNAMFASTLIVDHGIPNYHTTSTSASDNPNLDPFSSSADEHNSNQASVVLARSRLRKFTTHLSVRATITQLLIPSIHANRIGVNTL